MSQGVSNCWTGKWTGRVEWSMEWTMKFLNLKHFFIEIPALLPMSGTTGIYLIDIIIMSRALIHMTKSVVKIVILLYYGR